MSDRYLWDRTGKPDPEIENLEEALKPLRYNPKVEPKIAKAIALARPKRPFVRALRFTLAFAAVLWLALAIAYVVRPSPPAPEALRRFKAPTVDTSAFVATEAPRQFDVKRLAGAPRAGERIVGEAGALRVGDWLETDAASRAEIAVAGIGTVDVEPGSRLQLAATGPDEHRLELARGRISAKVDAPPRLFVVGTPSATAVDLGCAYSLEVDDAGASILHVSSGYVSLEWKKKTSLVPADASCRTWADLGPGIPTFDDAKPELKRALERFDLGTGGDEAVRSALTLARKRDSLSLWHLLFRVDESWRKRVFARLAELVPPPEGVGDADADALDRPKLHAYKESLRATW